MSSKHNFEVSSHSQRNKGVEYVEFRLRGGKGGYSQIIMEEARMTVRSPYLSPYAADIPL